MSEMERLLLYVIGGIVGYDVYDVVSSCLVYASYCVWYSICHGRGLGMCPCLGVVPLIDACGLVTHVRSAPWRVL